MYFARQRYKNFPKINYVHSRIQPFFTQKSKKTQLIFATFTKMSYFCKSKQAIRVSPVRHAPSEFPQGLTAARVLGCSGAI